MPTPLLLELDLTGEVLEAAPTDPLGRLRTRHRSALPRLLDALRDAARDPRVGAVVVKAGGRYPALAHADELREALQAVSAAGTPTVAWAESFGELGPGTPGYYLATGCEQVWLQPSGSVGLTGVAASGVFVHRALRRAGVEPQLDRRHEYKNAADTFLQDGFTPAHREATEALAASAYDHLVAAVAAARGLSVEVVGDLVDRSPLSAADALAAGLVDRLGYRDEVYAAVRARVGRSATALYAARYRRRTPPRELAGQLLRRSQPAVAVLRGTGPIVLGQGRSGALRGPSIGSDTLGAALRTAADADRVGAIVLRIDSPGGSYVASDAIWREVRRARESGTPVVVSMGRVAASGGYFVACAADAIVALPSTLTGSIGVFAGKAVASELLDRLGIGVDTVVRGAHAAMWSPTERYAEGEWQLLQQWLDAVYADFVGKVAAGRRMPLEQVDAVARGRVWTGVDAQRRGLVDELGGLGHAVAVARQVAGLPDNAKVRPWPQVPLLRRLRPVRSSEDRAAAAGVGSGHGAGGDWGGLDRLAVRLGRTGPLTMPPVSLDR